MPNNDRPYPPGTAWDEAWRQRQRADRLEDALKKIANLYWQGAPCPQEMRDIAKAKLEHQYDD